MPRAERFLRPLRTCAAALLLLTSVAHAAAQAASDATSGPSDGTGLALLQDEVLTASQTHFPSILEAMAKRRSAAGDLLASQGSFDLVFSADGLGWASGFYDGRYYEGKASRRFRTLGAEVYGGYAVSRGDFPIYQDEFFTNRQGKAKVGVIFNLLRDRAIDAQRFAERDARLALDVAELELLLTRIGVQQQALSAYWQWVKAGHRLAVYENLLKIAQERQEALRREVDSGARASIFLTENLQNILRRQTLVQAAQRDFRIAANDLGFYLRDADGAPAPPAAERLPPLRDDQVHVEPRVLGDLPRALADRPELRVLRTAAARADNRIALAENALQPKVEFKVEVGEAFGQSGEGGSSRDTTDTIVGLEFEVPLQRRAARGDLAAERADRDALGFATRQLVERIELEVGNIVVELEAAIELVNLASQEVAQATIMRNAEVKRFQSGASDFFLVNLREQFEADARIRFLAAELERRIAEAEYAAATVDLAALGLEVAGREAYE